MRTVELQGDVNDALEREARSSGRSVDDVLNAALRRSEHQRRHVAEGLSDVEHGRVVSNAAMISWLSSWGDDDEQDAPPCPE